jgi:gliding motility-associated protein GldE
LEEVDSISSFISAGIQMGPFTVGILAEIFLLIVLLFFSAMISGSEVAYFSLSPANLQSLEKKKSSAAKLVLKHIDNPERLLATILIGNNFVNVAIIILSTILVNQLFDFSASPLVGFAIQVIGITFLLLLFGEILPKIYANHHPVMFASFMAIPVKGLMTVFQPLSYLLVKSSTAVNKKLSQRKKEISMSDLSHALDLTASSIKEDKKILKGILNFGNIHVTDIMKPRIDVVAVDILTPLSKLVSVIVDSGYSRIPVYSNTFDDVKGILYVKDLLPHIQKGDTFKWQTLLRVPYFVPETKRINDLLKEFQQNKIHMSLVVDEYGGTAGIVTLEDILEEIVGEIIDEFDSERSSFTKIDENNYLFDGKTTLIDFYKIMHISDEIFDEVKGDADTLAGLILEIKGEIPEKNKVISYQNFDFFIESADRRRIKKIKVTLKPVT